MRALHTTAAFLLAMLGFAGRADAHVPLWAPRVSLSLALDWNRIAVDAVTQRPAKKPPARAKRHQVPILTLTSALPAPATARVVAAYDRAQTALRLVLIPHYVNPDVDHRRSFRQFYVVPNAPYLGAYGLILTVETDSILR